MSLELVQRMKLYDDYKDALRKAAPGEVVWIPDDLPDEMAKIAAYDVSKERGFPEWPIDAPQPAGGNKHDGGKLPLHLLPVDALEAITEILDFGAKKYAPRNWEKGLDWSRVYRAAIGHLFKWWRGAGPDEETGKSHLWHAGCCVLFLISYEIRGVGKDDRPSDSA